MSYLPNVHGRVLLGGHSRTTPEIFTFRQITVESRVKRAAVWSGLIEASIGVAANYRFVVSEIECVHSCRRGVYAAGRNLLVTFSRLEGS